MNKIGLSTSCVFPGSVEQAFSLGHEAGYDGIEIMITNDKETRDKDFLQRMEDKYSLPVLSFHAPVLLLTHFVWGTDPETKLRKTAELTASMGASTVVVHPPFSWQGEYSTKFLNIVDTISLDTGVKIGVENMFPWRYKKKELKAYKPSWETIVAQTPNITLDFSHAALSGLDSLGIVKSLGDKLCHIHLCDGVGVNGEGKDKIFDEHLLPGEGGQPVKETLEFLKKSKWDGHVVAEINTRKAGNRAAKLELLNQTLAFARNALS